jgi:hypothetical protein
VATTGLGPVIALPAPVVRPVGLFLTTAISFPWLDRYALGVKFQTTDLSPLGYEAIPSGGPCADMDTVITPRNFTDVEEQGAFSVIDAVTCSSIGKTPEELQADLVNHMALVLSAACAKEAMYGSGGSTHNLSGDATVVAGTFATVHDGIAELEERLATANGNTQGFLHMAPSALTYAILNGAVNRRGDIYYSPSGHVVIADAGYQAVESSTTTVMYGSGPVYYALDDVISRAQYDWEMNDWTHNDLMAMAQAYGIILYDPNTVFQVTATRA